MSVTIRAPRQIASGLDAFFEAAADGDKASMLLAAIMQAVFGLGRETASALGLRAVAVTIGGGVSLRRARRR